MRRIALAAALTAIACLAIAATAAADSLVYIKDDNVWVAAPDGSQQRQLTTDGNPTFPYRAPSQANDGSIYVLRDRSFLRLDRQGTVQAKLDSILVNAPPGAMGGPWDPRISPDGSTLVYTVGVQQSWHDPSTGWDWTTLGFHSVWMDARTGQTKG